MRARRALRFSIRATLLLALAAACSDGVSPDAPRNAAAQGPLRVDVVNYPLAYFAERIGGDDVAVSFPAPPDVDPAAWSPDPEVVAGYQLADLVLLNGAGYADWIRWATLWSKRLVETSAAFRDRLLPVGDAITHQHGPTGEHSHGATAFTTWLDPQLATLQARAVQEALAGAHPSRAGRFGERFAALEADLAALDGRLAAAARELGDAPVLYSHPVYQYLQRRYGLNGRSLHWEPNEAPAEGGWQALERLLVEQPARLMLWEAPPLEATRERLAALGVLAVVFDPCANTPAAGDYLDVMTGNADRLAQAASRGSGEAGGG